MGEIQRLLNSASRDCVIGERNSFVSLQANSGVEVLITRSLLCCFYSNRIFAARMILCVKHNIDTAIVDVTLSYLRI